MREITKRAGGLVAAIVSVAMLFCLMPASTASAAEIGADASAKANVIQALQYMQQLNDLRANKGYNRRALTAQDIADAQNADRNAGMTADQVADDTADGKYVPPVKVNWDLMKWAQTRANELVEKGALDMHANMYHGVPIWYARPNSDSDKNPDYNLTNAPNFKGGYFFGPEALAYSMTSAGGISGNAIDSWYSELNATGTPAELKQDRQGYGHYLTEVSRYADIAGIGVAVKNGVTITVLEIGNSYQGEKVTGKNETVEDALNSLKSIESVTAPTVTVESGTVKPTDKLPKTVAVKYDDGTTGNMAVTWAAIPDTWNKDHNAHSLTIHGTIAGYSAGVDLTLKVNAAKSTKVAIEHTAVTTPSGTKPTLDQTATVSWSNGDTTNANVTWTSNDAYKKREGAKYDLTGTVDVNGVKHTVKTTVTVTPATVKSAADPTAVSVVKGTKPTVPSTAKVTWSNGDVTDETIAWNAGSNPTNAAFDKVGDYTFTGTAQGATVTWKVTVSEATITGVDNPADTVSTDAGTAPKLPGTVTAHWSNGSTSAVAVTWDKFDGYTNRKGGDFTVNGTVNGWNGKVTVKVHVNPAKAVKATLDVTKVTTESGTAPALPKTATVAWSDGGKDSVETVTWEAFDGYKNRDGGDFTVKGTAAGLPVSVAVHVNAAKPVSVENDGKVTASATVGATTVALPETVNVTWSNGDKVATKVTWDKVDAAQLQKAGTFTVSGKAGALDVTATVTVSESTPEPEPSEPSEPSTPSEPDEPEQPSVKRVAVYRLYNPASGLHLYSTDANERKVLTTKRGWKDEGIVFYAAEQSEGATPVYRLYNAKTGQHLITMDANERKVLTTKRGWKSEGVAWYQAKDGTVPVYRMYSPKLGEHLYTTDTNEYQVNAKRGWNQEGIAWKGLK